MSLKPVIEKLEEVDEAFRGEYKETKNAAGVTVYALDIDGNIEHHPAAKALKDELGRRRISEKAAKDQLTTLTTAFNGRGTPEEIIQQLDRIPELEAAATGKLDEAKINTLVESRIKAKIAPIERERDQLKGQLAEKDQTIASYKDNEVKRSVRGALTQAARAAKVIDAAMEDVEVIGERLFEVNDEGNVVAKDKVGITPGISPKEWITEMQAKRPHWWGTTGGGGATGNRGGAGGTGGVVNPFAHDTWNVTEQGNLVRRDRALADKLAKQAGTVVGGVRPKPQQKAA